MIMCDARNIVVLFQSFSLFKKYWASFQKIWGPKRALIHFVNRKHPLLVLNFNQCLYHLSFRKIQFLSKSADCFWILKKGQAHQIVIQTTQMSYKGILKLWKVNKYERIKVVTDTFFGLKSCLILYRSCLIYPNFYCQQTGIWHVSLNTSKIGDFCNYNFFSLTNTTVWRRELK